MESTGTETHPTTDRLMSRLSAVLEAPSTIGSVAMIVARPAENARVELDVGTLVAGEGLIGDNYLPRGNRFTPDGKADPEAQLNLMMARALDAVSDDARHRWQLAGDQLIVDFDLTAANVPPGTRLQVGTAVIEVSEKPHRGCAKFSKRFGVDAARWVNHDDALHLRGINAMVVTDGLVHVGDAIEKLA